MTDLIEKIARAMRTEFRKLYGKEWSGPHNPPSFTTSDLVLASAALSVIKENAGDLVKPLVWTERWGVHAAAERLYLAKKDDGGDSWYVCYISQPLRDEGGRTVWFDDIGQAKEAAQQHHTARVISLLNLEVE